MITGISTGSISKRKQGGYLIQIVIVHGTNEKQRMSKAAKCPYTSDLR